MKIVHICEFYLDNWKYQENLLPAFQVKLGHTVTILASTTFPSFVKDKIYSGPSAYVQNGVKIIRYELIKSFLNFKISGIIDLIKQETPDLIYIHGFHFLRCKKLTKFIRENRQVKITMDSHADYFSSAFQSQDPLIKLKAQLTYRLVYKPLIKRVINHLNKFFCISPASVEFAHEILGISKDKIQLLPLGVDLHDIPYDKKETLRNGIRLKYNIPSDAIIIITAGKLDKEKRPVFLADAFNSLNKPETYLFIVGSLDNEIREDLTAFSTKNKRIILTGWVSSNDLIEILLASDIAVYPGSQSVLWQQTLGCGLPVIFKYWVGVEYLDLGNALFLYTSDTNELKEHLTYLIENKDARLKMGNQSRMHCIQSFNYEQIARLSTE